MNNNPTVSVIIPVYNCEKYISDTIHSALNQTYTNLEIIVVDDGSTDSTANIVKSFYEKHKRVKYFYQKNKGVSVARNRAIRESHGKYIAVLDHDDLWMPEKIEKQIALFNKNPNLGLVFCDTIFFEDGKGDLYNIYYTKPPPRGRVFDKLLAGNFISCETVIIPRDILDELEEWFPEDMEMSEEYDLFLRIAYSYEIGCVDEPLAKYRLHKDNDHKKRDHLLFLDGYRIIKGLKNKIKNFEKDFKKPLNSNIRTLLYYECLHLWKKGNKLDAMSKLVKMLHYGFDKRVPLVLPWIVFNHNFYHKTRTFFRSRFSI